MDASDLRSRQFRTLHDRIVVEVPLPEEKVTAGGIIIPVSSNDRVDEGNMPTAFIGRVVSVGPGRMCSRGKKKWFAKTHRKVGERVVFARHSGETVPLGYDASTKSVFFQIHDDEVIAVIDGEDEVKTLSDESHLHAVKVA